MHMYIYLDSSLNSFESNQFKQKLTQQKLKVCKCSCLQYTDRKPADVYSLKNIITFSGEIIACKREGRSNTLKIYRGKMSSATRYFLYNSASFITHIYVYIHMYMIYVVLTIYISYEQ